MDDFGSGRFRDVVILVARILLVMLFLIFGWQKLTGYAGTVERFAQISVPVPPVAAIVSILMECFVGLAILLGVWTRPLAALLALYTLATGFLGHQYWTMTGMAQVAAMINFYKNVSIMGGLLLLYATGAGKYSVDALSPRQSQRRD
jgi:putative oxidoreductase